MRFLDYLTRPLHLVPPVHRSNPRRSRAAGISTWVAVLLAFMWVPVSSHEWLESLELIHQSEHAQGGSAAQSDNHPDGAAHHEAADGDYRLDHGTTSVKAPVAASVIFNSSWCELLARFDLTRENPHPAGVPRGTAPPGVVVGWQFDRRAALPPLAPGAAS
jgi:hypothetical protein